MTTILKFILGAALFFTSLSASAYSVRPEWRAGFDAVYSKLEENLRQPNRRNPYYHVHPARKYIGVYMWDSAFISLIWKDHNPAIAQDVIRSVLHRQYPNGRIPQVVSILGPNDNGISNPSVLSYATLEIVRKTRDLGFVREVYPKLRAYNNWLFSARRLPNGLFYWLLPYESGIDNSPKYSNRDESVVSDTTEIAAADASAYAVLDSESVAELADMIGEKADAAALRARAAQVTGLMRGYLWHEGSGHYLDRNVRTGKFIATATITSLIPLIAGVPTEAQWLRLRQHITDPTKFFTKIPLPTVSHSDRLFEKDMWRGPVWINTAYLVIKGVKRYGDAALTRELSEKLVTGVYKTWDYTGQFYEFYDPDRFDIVELNRKKGLGPLGLSGSRNPVQVAKHLVTKRLILGPKPVNHFVGWTGLVNALVIDELQ